MTNPMPSWYPPNVGIPDISLALPAEVAVALGCFWLTASLLSFLGVFWEATRRQRPLGNPKKGAPSRRGRRGAQRPALYPV